MHRPAQPDDLARQPFGDAATPPGHDRPPDPVPQCGQQQPERAGQGSRQRLHGVGRRAGHQRPGTVGVKARRQPLRRRHAHPGEAGQGQRVAGHRAHGSEDIGHDRLEILHQRSHHPSIRRAIPTQPRRRLVHAAVQRGGASAVERVGESHLGLAQVDAQGRQVEGAEEG